MRSVLIAGSYAPSLINFRGPLIAALTARQWRVVTTAPDIDQTTADQLIALGAKPVSLPMGRTTLNPLSDLAYFYSLLQLIRQERVDQVLSYTIKPNVWGAFAAHRAGVPSVAMLTGLGYAFTDAGEAASGISRKLTGRLARRLYRKSTDLNRRVIFQNRDDVRDFTGSGCLSDLSKVRMVDGSGVDLAHYAPQPLPPQPRFLLIARLLKNKGVREYAQAALRLAAEMPDARFELVGSFDEGPDGIDRQELERWVAGGLIWHGAQADVRPFIASASVFVLPSYREGTPRAVLEAMAMGRPVIVADAPGCRETVSQGENGLLVPVLDVAALADAMRRLGEDPDLRERMGAASLDRVKARFDVNHVNAQVIAVLEEP